MKKPTDPLRTPVHRIVYQSDTTVVTACGLAIAATRAQVRDSTLTLSRGVACCDKCGDYDWPLDVLRPVFLRRRVIDLTLFRRQFLDGLLAIAAESKGVMPLEVERQYLTNARFHLQVDTIVELATAVVQRLEQVQGDTRISELRGLFDDEAGGLLGWDETGR